MSTTGEITNTKQDSKEKTGLCCDDNENKTSTDNQLKERNSTRRTIQIPHLDDPEKQKDILDKENEEIPGFTVRLGTSLTRKNADAKARILFQKLAVQSVPMYSVSHVPGLESLPRSRRTSVQKDRSLRTLTRALGKMSHTRTRLSMGSIADSLGGMTPAEPTEKPFIKFRRIARTVRLLARILLTLKSYVQEPDISDWSFMEMYLHVRDDLHKKVAFNPHSYVRAEPKRDKLKELLSIPKDRRTLDDVKMILSLMSDNTSFKDYPAHTQIQLAMCMEYQTYEARRIILRQGHIPSAFYIVLSGTAIVNIRDHDPRSGKGFSRTVHEIVAGDIFGEIALLESGKRTATVICKTPCELLVVQKEDFEEIIKYPLMREKEDHINFCRDLPLFRDFPCEVFAAHSSGFFYQYFRKGAVVVKDSRDSKFIIVVKEGACHMTSDVMETAADRWHGPMFAKHMEDAFPLYSEMKKIRASARRQKTDESYDDSRSIGMRLLTGRLDSNQLVPQGHGQLGRTGKRKSRHYLLKKSSSLRLCKENMENIQRIHTTDSGEVWTNRNHAHPNGFRHSADVHRRASQPDCSRPQIRSAMTRNRSIDEIQMTANLNIPSFPQMVPRTLHAQISELKSGSVFGLEALISRPSTTLSLVSDGAECIFISKKVFLKAANIKVLRIVTDLVHTHPCHDYIKDQVYTYRKWRQYKMATVLEVIDRNRRMEVAFVGGVPNKKYPAPSEPYY